MSKRFKISIQVWSLSLIGSLLLVDLLIFLDVSIFRQVLVFMFFTIVPGLLLVQILGLNKIELLKKIILSIGLSISYVMFIGYIINSMYPVIQKPLAFCLVLISLNISMIILILILYLKYKYSFNLSCILDPRIDISRKQISPLIFSMFFPFMAAFGTYLMNTQGNNIILLTMLFLIPVYVVVVAYLDDKISKTTYPVAIWMIAVSLTLMHGLTSFYILGSDIHLEYYVFRLTLHSLHWSIDNFRNSYNSCLSITILPVIYQKILNVDPLYIYKLFMQLLFSTIVLVLYVLCRRYLCEKYSFLACFYFVSQSTFIFELVEHIRQEVALLFFALLMFVLFDDEISKAHKKILFIIFVVCMVVSHYTTTYIFLLILISSFLFLDILKIERKWRNVVPSTVLLCFLIMFLWYGQLTIIPYSDVVKFLEKVFIDMRYFSVLKTRSPAALRAVGIGLRSIPGYIRFIVRDITYLFTGLGCIYLVKNYRESISKVEYICIMLISAILIFLAVIVPYVSKGYGITRLYIQVLILLAPAFVVGVWMFFNSIFRVIYGDISKNQLSKIKKFSLIAILVILILQNICATSLIYNIFGIPYSVDLNTNGNYRESLYIYSKEVFGSMWLAKHTQYPIVVRCDKPSYQRVYLGYEAVGQYRLPVIDENYFANNVSKAGYIYLRATNVILRKVHPTTIFPRSCDVRDIAEYTFLFIDKNKIYSNDGSEIYYS